jgi:exopolyphosphatase / guanosine-5'-triphosphate,3'-diphosphate pyrophosphatase
MNNEIKTYAAVDIGSNAVRLLVYHIYPNSQGIPVFKKYALTRVPIRLGDDVFGTGEISAPKAKKLAKALLAFRHLAEIHNVEAWRVCATSAMREATNGNEIVEAVKAYSGVRIEIIDGSEEANLMVSTHISDGLDINQDYLYIDVGGGSTELSLFRYGEKIFTQSYSIGTVRLLQNKVARKTWLEAGKTVQSFKREGVVLKGIGSGGNIIKLMKLANQLREDKPLTRAKLKKTYEQLSSLSYEQRIRDLGLNPDRADVIVPAAEIFLYLSRKAGIREILVPKVGISDGIIRNLYDQNQL